MRLSKSFQGPLVVLGAGAVAAATVFACVGDPPAISDKADSATPSPGVDASQPPMAMDAGSDTTVTDAQPPVDTGAADNAVPVDAAKTHCQAAVAPPGATDFFCADFDSTGFGAWTQVFEDDGGTLQKVTAVAVSPPNSLGARALNSGGGGALQWQPAGAMSFIETTAHFQINPAVLGGVVSPTTGDVDLIDIRTQSTSVTFSVTRGGFGETANYSGYLLKLAAFGGAAVLTVKNVNTPLTPNAWTDVKLTYTAAGNVKLLYNNITIVDVMGYGATDPSVTFKVGAEGTFTNSVPEVFRYDDVELSIRR